jgi:hypothetical protein
MCVLHKKTKAASTAMRRMTGAHSQGTPLLRRYWVRLAPLRQYLSNHPLRMASTSQEILDLFEAHAPSRDTNTSRVRSPITDSLPQPGDEIRTTTKPAAGIFN